MPPPFGSRRTRRRTALDRRTDLLALALLPKCDPRLVQEALRRHSAADLLTAAEAWAGLLSPQAAATVCSVETRERARREEEHAAGAGVQIVGRDDEAYPRWLRRTFDPPLVLWVRGSLRAGEGEAAVAIVGSRAATPEGASLAHGLGRDLAAAGVSVVSGLARGVDSAAHRGALAARGRTVAILGSGLQRVYPAENAPLAEAIASGGGAVVSEFPLATPPRPAHFPRRNRVIAGWGRAVVVVEARERSGALVTARLALDEGREVMAVPGHPASPLAAGVNRLIRDGAALVRDAQDVADELGLALRRPGAGGPPQDAVLAALKKDVPATVDEVLARTGRPLPEVLARLGELELEQAVVRLPGALYLRQ